MRTPQELIDAVAYHPALLCNATEEQWPELRDEDFRNAVRERFPMVYTMLNFFRCDGMWHLNIIRR